VASDGQAPYPKTSAALVLVLTMATLAGTRIFEARPELIATMWLLCALVLSPKQWLLVGAGVCTMYWLTQFTRWAHFCCRQAGNAGYSYLQLLQEYRADIGWRRLASTGLKAFCFCQIWRHAGKRYLGRCAAL